MRFKMDGHSFVKHLYATRYLEMSHQVMVHGFDTFSGLPDPSGLGDQSFVKGGGWEPGYFPGRYDELRAYCAKKQSNFALHKGLFENTITNDFLQTLQEHLPVLIWIDCDYYSSAKTIFERLAPYIPTGCVVYFDDLYYNFGSRFTGEARVVWEINQGVFGEGLELVLDRELMGDSNRVFRFVNLNAKRQHQWVAPTITTDIVHPLSNGSPFP